MNPKINHLSWTLNLGVAKRVSPTCFGPARLWPAKNGLGRAGTPPINGLDIVIRLVLGQAGGPAGWRFFFFFF